MDQNTTTLIEIVEAELLEYCSQDLESKGINDAMQNPDLLNRDMNKTKIVAGLKRIILHRLPQLQKKIFEYDEIIRRYEGGGMIQAAAPYVTKKNTYENIIAVFNGLLENEATILKKLEYVILTYSVGFHNGLRTYHEKI
jgi:hypothetical protein